MGEGGAGDNCLPDASELTWCSGSRRLSRSILHHGPEICGKLGVSSHLHLRGTSCCGTEGWEICSPVRKLPRLPESHDEFRGETRETECVNTCICRSQAQAVYIKCMCTNEHALSEHIQTERYMHTNGHLSIKQQSGIGAQR